MILLVVTFWYGAGDDEGRTGVIDQYAVHFIHHGEVVFTLHHLFRGMDHVITEVVEAEFVIGTIGNIGQVRFATGFAVGFMLVDTVHRKTQPFEDGAIPFGVTTGEVVVDRHDMNAFAGQGIEIGREGRDKGLTFTGGHFSDLSLVQYGAANELYVV